MNLDILPVPFRGLDSGPHEPGFLFRRGVPSTVPFVFGLAASPQADTASPAANTFLAALTFGGRELRIPHGFARR